MAIDPSITIVGGLPRPIGGVTTFVRRLLERFPDRFSCVLDLYPASDKTPTKVRHKVFGRLGLVRLFLEFLFFVRGPVYFNFSRPRSLVFVMFLPRFTDKQWGLTLHNGDLAGLTPVNRLMRSMCKHGMRRFDSVGSLSGLQEDYFLSMGVARERIHGISSFIPPRSVHIPPPDSVELPELVEWHRNGLRIFVISGYPTSIYRHAEVLAVFQEQWRGGCTDLRLAAFLYGEDSDHLLPELRQKFGAEPFAALYWGKDESVFLSALSVAEGYIRMNTVDSYGIAVAEARVLGKAVIATNVCERYLGTCLVDVDDFAALAEFIRNVPIPPAADSRDDRIEAFIGQLGKT